MLIDLIRLYNNKLYSILIKINKIIIMNLKYRLKNVHSDNITIYSKTIVGRTIDNYIQYIDIEHVLKRHINTYVKFFYMQDQIINNKRLMFSTNSLSLITEL